MAPPAAASPSPQLRPLLTTEQETDLNRRFQRSLEQAEKSLGRVPPHRQQEVSVERAKAFIKQAQQAQRQGDLIRATSLAERAELLASELAQTPR